MLTIPSFTLCVFGTHIFISIQFNLFLEDVCLINDSSTYFGLVLACTYRRNGLRGLQDRPVDLSLRGLHRVDGGVISLEVDT